MKSITKFLLSATLGFAMAAFVSAQDAPAPVLRLSPSPAPPRTTPEPTATPRPTPAPTPTPSATATPKPQPSPTPSATETPRATPAQTPTASPAGQTSAPPARPTASPSSAKRPRRGVLREKPVRALEPRKPWIRRIPAEHNEGARLYRPTFDLSVRKWATNASLRSLENKWRAALKAHDTEALEKLIADDFVGTSSTGKRDSKETLLRQMRRDKNVYRSTNARRMSVRMIRPGVAVVTGIATETGKRENGERFSTAHKFRDTWKQRQGRWECVASEVTQIPKS